MKTERTTGFRHLWKATGYSLAGLRDMLGETAFRHELLCGLVELPAAWLLPGLSLGWRLLLTLVWLSMPALETVNTAIEAVVDLASPERHPLARKAKDLGSCAVFFAILANLLAWGCAVWMLCSR